MEKIKDIRAVVLHEIAFIESALDDPEHVSLDGYPEQLRGIMSDAHSKVKKLLDSSDNGKMLKEGINTAIVGNQRRKISLLNILVERSVPLLQRLPVQHAIFCKSRFRSVALD